MNSDLAVRRLSAIAQDSRLAVFRLLVKAGPEGLAAGDIARKLDTPANTMSAQLLVLSNAGLVRARREGRSIIYAVDFEAMRDLLVFLTEDCCGGRAEICAPLAAIAASLLRHRARRHAMKRLHVHVAVDDLETVHRLLFDAVRGGAVGRQGRLRQVDARRSARELRDLARAADARAASIISASRSRATANCASCPGG